MGWEDDFEELADELDDFGRRFKREARRDPETGEFRSESDSFSPKKRIFTGMRKGIRDDIVPEAKRRASRYVPSDAVNSIQSYSVSWNKHYFGATDELVKYHEYGTGPKALDRNKATINAPSRSGYIIPFDGYPVQSENGVYGPDNFPAALEQLGPEFQYSVHPGVSAQRFMFNTVRDKKHKLLENVVEEFEAFGNSF